MPVTAECIRSRCDAVESRRKGNVQKAIAAAALALSLGAAAVGAAACHQQTPSFEARLAHEVLTFWHDLERKLVEMSEDFPEARDAYKPTPEARSFSDIVHHVAEENFVYIQTARGERVDRDSLRRGHFSTKGELAGFLKKSFDEGAALLANTTDRDMLDQVTTPYGKRLTRLAFWLELVQHAAEHYGNLVTYYRLNGLVPPETRRAQQPSGQPAR